MGGFSIRCALRMTTWLLTKSDPRTREQSIEEREYLTSQVRGVVNGSRSRAGGGHGARRQRNYPLGDAAGWESQGERGKAHPDLGTMRAATTISLA